MEVLQLKEKKEEMAERGAKNNVKENKTNAASTL